MAEIKVTNMVKFYTLVLLSEGPHHGYDIITCIGKKTGRTVSPGQMYPFLTMLEKKKYIRSRKSGTRDKKTYSLTPRGKQFVRDMLERFGEIVHASVEASVKKCAHCECEIYRGGFEKRLMGKRLVFCCRNCAAAFGKR